MLHIDYLLSDENTAEYLWDDIAMDLGGWEDPASCDGTEFDLALHNLPTEQELMNMEANSGMDEVDEFQLRKERRIDLRH